MPKRAALWSIKVALFALLVDGIFGVFGVLSIHRGNPYRLYYASRLAAEVEADLPHQRCRLETLLTGQSPAL
jgi:hypothetical protein